MLFVVFLVCLSASGLAGFSGSFDSHRMDVSLYSLSTPGGNSSDLPQVQFNYMPARTEFPVVVCLLVSQDSIANQWRWNFREAYFVAFDDAPFEAPVFVVNASQRVPREESLLVNGFISDCSPGLSVNRVLGSKTPVFSREGLTGVFLFKPNATKMRLKVEIWDNAGRIVTDRDGKQLVSETVLDRNPSVDFESEHVESPVPPLVIAPEPLVIPNSLSYEDLVRPAVASDPWILAPLTDSAFQGWDAAADWVGTAYRSVVTAPKISILVSDAKDGSPKSSLSTMDFVQGDEYFNWTVGFSTTGLLEEEPFGYDVLLNGKLIAQSSEIYGAALNAGETVWIKPFDFESGSATMVNIEVVVFKLNGGSKQTVLSGRQWVPFNSINVLDALGTATIETEPQVIEVDPQTGETDPAEFDVFLVGLTKPVEEESPAPLTLTATACEPEKKTCIRIAENVREKFDAASKTVKSVILSERFQQIVAKAREQSVKNVDEPLEVKLDLMDSQTGQSATGSIIIKLSPITVDSTGTLVMTTEHLNVGLVGNVDSSLRVLTNSVSSGVPVPAVSLLKPEQVILVDPADFPVAVYWNWLEKDANWWKNGDYYPVIYLNPSINKTPVFDGSLAQLPEVESKTASQKGDFFADFSITPTEYQPLFENPIYEMLNQSGRQPLLPEFLVPIQNGHVKKTHQDWWGKSENFVLATDYVQVNPDVLAVVEIRSRSKNGFPVAAGSVLFRLPRPIESEPVTIDLNELIPVQPKAWTVPPEWVEYLKGKKEALVSICADAGKDIKECWQRPVKLQDGQLTKEEWEKLWPLLKPELVKAKDKALDMGLWLLGADQEPTYAGNIYITLACNDLSDCTSRIDKQIVSLVNLNIFEQAANDPAGKDGLTGPQIEWPFQPKPLDDGSQASVDLSSFKPCGKASPGFSPDPSCTGPVNLSAVQSYLYAFTNQVRQNKGLASLRRAEDLERLAQYQATEMATYGIVGHVDHEGLSLEQRAAKLNVSLYGEFVNGLKTIHVAENAAMIPWSERHSSCGSTQNDPALATCTVNGWVTSSGHYESLIGDYITTGMGVAFNTAENKLYAVQVFRR